MSLSLTAACLWAVIACVVAMLPSRDNHWSWAWLLTALGLPILGAVFWQHGIWVGLFVLLAAMSILRWPVFRLWRWLRGRD